MLAPPLIKLVVGPAGNKDAASTHAAAGSDAAVHGHHASTPGDTYDGSDTAVDEGADGTPAADDTVSAYDKHAAKEALVKQFGEQIPEVAEDLAVAGRSESGHGDSHCQGSADGRSCSWQRGWSDQGWNHHGWHQ